jgi:hypothetical protein
VTDLWSPAGRERQWPIMVRIADRSVHPVLTLFIGIFFGTWCGHIAYDAWSWDRALREHGRPATGRVVEITHGRGGHILVEYMTGDPRQVKASVEGGTATPVQVGDELPIRYDPSRPTGFVYDDRVTDQDHAVWPPAAFSAFILIASPVAAWSSHRSRRRAAAER